MLVEFVLFLANNMTNDNIGISIILLSFGINILCLPMYNVAEQWQGKERAIQKRMKAKIADIKAVFKGDERYLILSTYYRQNNYHPIYALRSMFALFIQIPFFIAAYQLLSHSSALSNNSFLFLHDLGSTDKLIAFNNIYINVLPVVMTVINIAAAVVYSKGFELKDKLTLYITALVFLILLYNSPSGLVLYWTLNNIFSLLKNIFYKIKLNSKTWYIIIVIAAIFLTAVTAMTARYKRPVFVAIVFTAIIVVIPLIKLIFIYFDKRNNIAFFDDTKKRFYLFFLATLTLTVFTGLAIPSMTIASSPLEFMHIEGFKHPLVVLYYPFIQSLGCLLWSICLYKFFSKASVQKWFTYLSLFALTGALINAFVFTGNYGTISSNLIFENAALLDHSRRYFVLNLVMIGIGLGIMTTVIYSSRLIKILSSILSIVLITIVVITVLSCVSIQNAYRNGLHSVVDGSHPQKAYRVSRAGKNIFILMLDRSMNFFIDPIFANSELVKKEYTGFTVFENTVAFGLSTNFSTPSLFGGYEYTPENINKRDKELLVDKHNEALSVLPRLFSEHNWLVSFTDPSWLNYSWIPDLSVFKKYPIIAQNIDASGKYRQVFLEKLQTNKQTNLVARNMLYFSFFRILPAEIRRIFYNNGSYGSIDMPKYIDDPFIDAYSALENLYNEVEFIPNGDCINIIVNNTTHEPQNDTFAKFMYGDFLVSLAQKFCLNQFTAEHFYVNYLAHESCARFFRFLKESGCWDNSRIIIVGDHGCRDMRTIDMNFLNGFDDTGIFPERLIPLLMMKDFNSDGLLHKDYSFMTLADIPILITEGLPSELQKNPFSSLPFKVTQNKTVIRSIQNGDHHADKQSKLTQFKTTESDWVYVKDNVYDPACWSRTGFNSK